ncbi:MAG TPA: hypothetical protein VGD17_11595 [Chitinophagaceae bacterium]
MPLLPDTRACLTCSNMLKGRIDKKFCDDYCRSAYNNQLYQNDRGLSFVRRVNNILRKNRKILEEIIPEESETTRVPRSKLVKMGFNFNYLTSAYSNPQGVVFYFCYEYGYRVMESDSYYIIRREEILK